ncbi:MULTISPECIES: hypothetical protein [Massilia]|uniref:Uncharacterized protein n=1 Tax=Massilia frigida TaxID=2609281 RepID=A0ABX0NCC1_9BURK|nr:MULTISPECIES: hypothetical protein [Massilia]MDQ1833216.1 hypothetical protein [Massilia sp. CCM 9029]NHZ80504.1 hypothetical protein [Massilia frigida]
MALADLMKKGFLTSATATGATVATVAGQKPLPVASVATVAVAKAPNDIAAPHSVATVATVAVANSKYPKSRFPEPWRNDLVAEFMEVDGLTRKEAEAMAEISIQPRTPAVWLAMIADLNALINTYCASAQISDTAKARMLAAASSQSLASIPESTAWFQVQLRTLAVHPTESTK